MHIRHDSNNNYYNNNNNNEYEPNINSNYNNDNDECIVLRSLALYCHALYCILSHYGYGTRTDMGEVIASLERDGSGKQQSCTTVR